MAGSIGIQTTSHPHPPADMSFRSLTSKRKQPSDSASSLCHFSQRISKRTRKHVLLGSQSSPSALPSSAGHSSQSSNSGPNSRGEPPIYVNERRIHNSNTTTSHLSSNFPGRSVLAQNAESTASPGSDKSRSTWTGLESALQALHITSELCPPLKSAVGGLVSWLDIFKVGRLALVEVKRGIDPDIQAVTKHREDYEDLTSNLRAMAELLGEYLKDPKSVQESSRLADICE